MIVWTPLIALAVFGITLGAGDIIAIKTKGMVSAVLIIAAVFLAGFWSGIIPADAMASTTMPGMISAVGLSLMIGNLGTMLDINQMKKEWRTVAVALAAVVGVGVISFTVGIAVFGREYALSAAGPLSGGMVATVLTQNAAIAAGKELYGAFAMLVFAFQIFIGMPIAAFMIKWEGKKLKQKGMLISEEALSEKDINIKFIPAIPEKYNTGSVKIAKLAVVCALGGILASFTRIGDGTPANYIINPNIAYLIMGILFTAFGFLDTHTLQKANANGMIMFACLTLIPNSFASITPSMFVEMVFPLLGMLVIGVIGIAVFSIVIGKFVGYSPAISVAIGLTALLGYPQTEIVTNEAVKGFDGTEEEKKILHERVLPKMLTGGFVTVTIASVVLAGVITPLIFN